MNFIEKIFNINTNVEANIILGTIIWRSLYDDHLKSKSMNKGLFSYKDIKLGVCFLKPFFGTAIMQIRNRACYCNDIMFAW